MSPRRSKLEMRLMILAAVKRGVDKPTRIMYAANEKGIEEIERDSIDCEG